MRSVKRIAAVIGIAALALVAVACSNGEAATGPEVKAGATSQSPAEQSGAVQKTVAASTSAGLGASGPPAQVAAVQTGSSQAGIWVTGQGSISLEPDLVMLNVGVETMGLTVAVTRNEAATAMAAIVQAVKARGLDDKDIQTRSFSIFPRYEFPEVSIGGTRTRQQTLVGYTVSNTAVIRIRDLDSVGPIIDEVADAGGDATRINGIDFTVEDTKPFMDQLREDAVKDAIAKADQFAGLTGVSVGSLMFISEVGGGIPVVRDLAQVESMVMTKAASPTSISGGQLEISLNVQAVFAIQ